VRDVLAAIRALPFGVGPGTVASYLIGHGTSQVKKYDWQARPQFGVLKHRREDWTRRLLRRMLAAGVLALDAERQTLHVTRRSVDVISGARENSVRLPPLGQPTLRVGAAEGRSVQETLDGVSASLFERLKAWRRLRADGDGVPAYVICHDATLASIAERKPQSSAELLAVPGMGPAKMQRYGVQILAELQAHFAEHPEDEGTATVAAWMEESAVGDVARSSTLYEQLRGWRRREAVATGVKLWQVASNEALVSIAEARPSTIEELQRLGVLDDEQVARHAASMLGSLSGEGADVVPEHLRVGGKPVNFSEHQLKVREKHPRAYERWSDSEDARVTELHESGVSVEGIANELERQPGAVAMRLERLGLAPATA
jgi:superfamily II DNA helicase RecQ